MSSDILSFLYRKDQSIEDIVLLREIERRVVKYNEIPDCHQKMMISSMSGVKLTGIPMAFDRLFIYNDICFVFQDFSDITLYKLTGITTVQVIPQCISSEKTYTIKIGKVIYVDYLYNINFKFFDGFKSGKFGDKMIEIPIDCDPVNGYLFIEFLNTNKPRTVSLTRAYQIFVLADYIGEIPHFNIDGNIKIREINTNEEIIKKFVNNNYIQNFNSLLEDNFDNSIVIQYMKKLYLDGYIKFPTRKSITEIEFISTKK